MSPCPPQDWSGVFVVVAAYNEAGAVGPVVADLSRYVPPGRVIVVDDASGDDTAAVAAAAGATVLRHAINRGQGAALATGIAAALKLGARAVVTFDADGQHTADDLPAVVGPVLAGEADVVLGTRFKAGSQSNVPAARRVLLKLAVLMTHAVSGIRVSDAHNGYRALSAAAAAVRIRQDRMEHASEILDEVRRLRLRWVERPVTIRYSDYSLAKGQQNYEALRLAARILFNKVTH